MAAPTLNGIAPTFMYCGAMTRLRVNGSGIAGTAILRIIKSTSTLDAVNVSVAGDGTWIEGDLVIPPGFVPNTQYNVRVINVPPSTDQATLTNILDVRPPPSNTRRAMHRRLAQLVVLIADEDEFWSMFGGRS